MEGGTLKLAICYFGKKGDSERVLELAKASFPSYDIQLFSSIGTDRYYDFWRSSLKKRDYEIANQMEFDVCVGVCSDKFTSFMYTTIGDILVDRIYYTSGHYRKKSHRTGANFNIFFSKSLEFDRLAEFFHSRTYIKTEIINESEQFSYHIRTLDYDAECINCENSSLFIRTA